MLECPNVPWQDNSPAGYFFIGAQLWQDLVLIGDHDDASGIDIFSCDRRGGYRRGIGADRVRIGNLLRQVEAFLGPDVRVENAGLGFVRRNAGYSVVGRIVDRAKNRRVAHRLNVEKSSHSHLVLRIRTLDAVASAYAKYFQNSLREEALITQSRAGIVYASIPTGSKNTTLNLTNMA